MLPLNKIIDLTVCSQSESVVASIKGELIEGNMVFSGLLKFVRVAHNGVCGFNSLAFATKKSFDTVVEELISLKESKTVSRYVAEWATHLQDRGVAMIKKSMPAALWLNSKACK